MTDFFASGRAIDLIIAGMIVQALALTAYFKKTGLGVAPQAFLPNLMSGAFLMVAVRCALTGVWWGWVALLLLSSLAAHLADLRQRWRTSAAPSEHSPGR
jgi:hypothetical protein